MSSTLLELGNIATFIGRRGGDCLGCCHDDNFVDACFKIAVATNCVGGHWEELK